MSIFVPAANATATRVATSKRCCTYKGRFEMTEIAEIAVFNEAGYFTEESRSWPAS